MEIFTKLADFVAFNLLGIAPDTHLGGAVHFFVEDVAKIYFLIFAMVIFVSFFRSYLDSSKVKEYLEGKPKWIAYLLAVILGSITPFCSCSSIPLFIGFVEAGIPFGVTMAFLITSPMINEIAMAIFISVVGVKVTTVYIATGMIVGLIGGFLMEKFGVEKYVEPLTPKKQCCCCKKTENKDKHEHEEDSKPATAKIETVSDRVKYAVDYAWGIFKDVWFYVMIGIGIGAFLHGYVPQEFFIKYAGADNIFAVPIAVLLGVPLYSNATGVIPIAEALIGKGVPIGTVLVMMMSVVAISLPEMIILRRVLKVRALAYFCLYIFISLIIVGYIYNAVF